MNKNKRNYKMRWNSKEAISIIYYTIINVWSNKLKRNLTYKNKMVKNKMINNKIKNRITMNRITMNKITMNRITIKTKNMIIANYIFETKRDKQYI